MKKILFLLLLLSEVLHSQELPTENDIYNFINSKSLNKCNLDKASINYGYKCKNISNFLDFRHNYVLEKKSCLTILDDTTDIFSDSSYFSSDDIKYIRNQFSILNNFEWNENKILKASTINYKESLKYYGIVTVKKTDNDSIIVENDIDIFDLEPPCIYSISMPVFNLSKNICILHISEICGPTNSSGFTLLYKKIKNRWIVKKIYSSWVS